MPASPEPVPPELLKELQARFPSTPSRDLQRFLVARSCNVDRAAAMYEKHLEWKRSLPVGEALREQVLPELRKGKLVIRGRDKLGRPICRIRGAANDPSVRDLESASLAMVMQLVAATELADREGAGDGKITVIVDRQNATPDLALWKSAVRVLADNFPERLHVALIYPVNIVFSGMWSVLSYFLDPKTAEKVVCLTSPEPLLQHVDADQLPEALGGTDTWQFDPDAVTAEHLLS